MDKNKVLFVFVSGFVVLLDQLSKYFARQYLTKRSITIVDKFISLTFVKNEGAVFGLFQGSRVLFIILSFLAIIFISAFVLKAKLPLFLSIPISFVYGGVAGNLLDRIFLGYVTDFIYLNHWPVFNIADSMIDIGIVLIIFYMVKYGKNL
jgi:signal peptidase II